MRKNNIALLALTSLVSLTSISAEAKTLSCDYKDTIYVTTETAPVGTHILNVKRTWGDLRLVDLGNTSFALQGFCQSTDNGGIEITFGTAADNACTLTIKDGEFYSDPTVESIQCNGKLKYTGITYDGFMTYHYKLHFVG